MKTIIAGSRNITNYENLVTSLQQVDFKISEVVSGGARGVDQMGELYAKENQIPVKQFKPEWDRFGKRAGILRNIDMGDYAEALVALWDGKSRGTQHMIEYAKKKGLKIKVFILN